MVPELPDVDLYVHALRPRIVGQTIRRVRLAAPFLLRSVEPPLSAVEGRAVEEVSRLGKRIVIDAGAELYLVIHLMIAGRFRWRPPDTKVPGKVGLLALEFDHGTLILTEAGSKRRASLHLVQGRAALTQHDPGGIEVLEARLEEFAQALRRENHTLKRALTDPQVFSGIGNAYSDEILHDAHLSPVALTQRLSTEEIERLHRATQETLQRWIELLRRETGDGFPENVTAFRPQMAVHGKFGQACPMCGAKVQRIRYVDNETNYCPRCQTGGKLLADRSLSLLLKKDWPKTLEELEELRAR